MTFLVLLFTGSAIFAGIAVVSCVIAARHCREANHSATRLQHTRGTVVALEGIVTALDGRLQTLNGRVSAMKRWGPREGPRVDGKSGRFDDLAEPSGEIPCVNWRTTQFPEGDDCDFCVRMRAERAAALARLPANGVRSPRVS